MQTQKLSRLYRQYAEMIQFPPRHFAAKSLIDFLGEKANDGGVSWHSYDSIMSRTGLRNRTSMSNAIKFVRAYSVEQVGSPLFTYVKGSGGMRRRKNKSAAPNKNNTYKLNLRAMEALIKKQGIFDPATGRALQNESTEPSNESTERTSSIERVQSTDSTFQNESSQRTENEYIDSDANPHIVTLIKSKPNHSVEGGVFVFSESKPTAAQPSDKKSNEKILEPVEDAPTFCIDAKNQPALPCNLVRDWTRPVMLGHAKNVVKMATAVLEALAVHGDGTPEARIKTLVWQAGLELEPLTGGFAVNEEQLFASVIEHLKQKDDIRVREQRVYRMPYKPPLPEKPMSDKPKPAPIVRPPSKEQQALAAQYKELERCGRLAKQWELEKRRYCPQCDEGVPAGELGIDALLKFCCPVCGSSETSSVEAWLSGLKQAYATAAESGPR